MLVCATHVSFQHAISDIVPSSPSSIFEYPRLPAMERKKWLPTGRNLFHFCSILCYTSLMDETLTRTICIKLDVNGHDAVLQQTQQRFNEAASWIATICWDERITNTNTAHHRVYGETRSRFGLGLQLACCARAKAVEAVKAAPTSCATRCLLQISCLPPEASSSKKSRWYTPRRRYIRHQARRKL